ncbi:MAG TPA: DUF5694 domain-containing protein [Anaerolineae bacterium]|nr:DUF5694 domain-containing protein [Anaerolineae bacterium]
MQLRLHSMILATSLLGFCGLAYAQSAEVHADYLFVGSYHMGNPGRDIHNTEADDVRSDKRQGEIKQLARLIERYEPTRVMVEADASSQDEISKRFRDSCHGSRPFARNEVEQLGFRIACDMKLRDVIAVDWNDLGPIKDEDSINYLKAIERHGQQEQYQAHLEIGEKTNEKDQYILDHGTVLEMLNLLNSQAWLEENARSYFRIGLLGTQADPVGANWVQYWFGRNLTIFNNIVRNTKNGDRVLVIYGAGHGNYLRQLAQDSGVYRVHDPLNWLSNEPEIER